VIPAGGGAIPAGGGAIPAGGGAIPGGGCSCGLRRLPFPANETNRQGEVAGLGLAIARSGLSRVAAVSPPSPPRIRFNFFIFNFRKRGHAADTRIGGVSAYRSIAAVLYASTRASAVSVLPS
jgi:hypothetical protein